MSDEYFDTTLLALELEVLNTRPEACSTPAASLVVRTDTRQRQFRSYSVTSPKQRPLRGARRACECLTAEEHLSGCRRSS